MVATMREVAAHAGVALATVSRVIHNHASVRPTTRTKVHEAIAALQYVPDQVAGSLRSRQTGTLGLLVPTIANTFWMAIARGVEDEGEARGYSVFFCNTDNDTAKELRYLDALLRRRVEGIIVAPTTGSSTQLMRVQQRQLPLVQVHRKLDDLAADSIRADCRSGTVELTTRLLRIGCRRIAFLGAVTTLPPERDCLGGYQAAMADAGIAVDPALVKLGPAQPEVGYARTVELLQAVCPEALCIGNSRLAIGALHALQEAGLQVPDDIRVATLYDSTTLDDSSSTLIMARPPAYAIGRASARRLLERITGLEMAPGDILLPYTITSYPLAATCLTRDSLSIRYWAIPAILRPQGNDDASAKVLPAMGQAQQVR